VKITLHVDTKTDTKQSWFPAMLCAGNLSCRVENNWIFLFFDTSNFFSRLHRFQVTSQAAGRLMAQVESLQRDTTLDPDDIVIHELLECDSEMHKKSFVPRCLYKNM